MNDAFASELASLLRSHSEELADATVASIRQAGLDVQVNMTAELMETMRPTALASVDMLLSALEEGEDWTPVLPPEVTQYLREMARQGASLEAVIRVFAMIAGVSMEFWVEKIDKRQAQELLSYIGAWQARYADRLMNAFTAEYMKEVERLDRAPSRELADQVRKLLSGGSAESAALSYELDSFHIGVIAVGAGADQTCRSLAEKLGCNLLILPEPDRTVWAWLGARREIDVGELEPLLAVHPDPPVVAAGEARDGVVGWRLTHQEAQTALPVALLEGRGLTRCSNVALLAHGLSDEAVGRSLVDRYLKPLEQHRDSAVLQKTLRTYFDLDCNAASTASSLGVNRHTIQRRLARVEQTIGESLSARRAELDVALRLEDLTGRRAEPPLSAAR